MGTGLHLDEDQAVLVPGHEIEFSGRASVVPGKDLEPRGTQVIGGGALTEGSTAEVGRTFPGLVAGPDPREER